MKLQQPTDFRILEILAEKGRNVAPNIALEIEKSRSHVNVRLPVLADYDLVQKIGPSENSGLYEITEKGEAVVELRDHYDTTDKFERYVEGYAAGELEKDTIQLHDTDEVNADDLR